MRSTEHATLHWPHSRLAHGIMLAVERDTRGVNLNSAQRFNHYPASPLPVISWIFEGELRMVRAADIDGGAAQLGPVLPSITFAGPHDVPTASWSPGAVHALTVSVYPECLTQLLPIDLAAYRNRVVPMADVAQSAAPALWRACLAVQAEGNANGDSPFERLQHEWARLMAEPNGSLAPPSMRAWLQALSVRLAFSRAGVSVRQWQRTVKTMIGQSQRDLMQYAKSEAAFERVANWPAGQTPHWADIAADTGYADQSHLGRETRRLTGLSPQRLLQRMADDEAFWLYRLLQQHHRARH